MLKRSMVMLAHVFKPTRNDVRGWFMSEKLDGHRALWDGGVSRGMLASEVPYANTLKDSRLLKAPVATGLWSRLGKVIHAPDWWLDQLPPYCLDGELWCGRNGFQRLSSIVKKHTPDAEAWKQVQYMVFDAPPVESVFCDGIVTAWNAHWQGMVGWYKTAGAGKVQYQPQLEFQQSVELLGKTLQSNDVVRLLPQIELPNNHTGAASLILDRQIEVVKLGGEGLILRRPTSVWSPERSYSMLKVKPLQDAEGKVVGYHWGRETDKGSKLLGMLGSIVVEFQGKQFDLSGFTDAERKMFRNNADVSNEERLRLAAQHGSQHPGELVDHDYSSVNFPRGSYVTFKYRELSDDGIPKEARYFRGAQF